MAALLSVVTFRRTFLASGVATIAGLAGCSALGRDRTTTASSESDSPTTTPSPTPKGPRPASSESVGMSCTDTSDPDAYFFSPALVWIRPGAEVLWAPTSRCRQQTLAYHPDNDLPRRIPEGAESWQSPVVQGTNQSSSEFTHTFETVGVYQYAGLHREFGQVGTVVVGYPDSLDDEPGMQPVQDEIEEMAREELRTQMSQVRALFEEAGDR